MRCEADGSMYTQVTHIENLFNSWVTLCAYDIHLLAWATIERSRLPGYLEHRDELTYSFLWDPLSPLVVGAPVWPTSPAGADLFRGCFFSMDTFASSHCFLVCAAISREYEIRFCSVVVLVMASARICYGLSFSTG